MERLSYQIAVGRKEVFAFLSDQVREHGITNACVVRIHVILCLCMTRRIYPKELKIICITCGKSFMGISRHAVRGLTKTCGKSCQQALAWKNNRFKKELSKQRSLSRMAEKNPMWKGDDVGYGSLHTWVRKRKTKPSLCENCKIKPSNDLANISQKYKRELTDWEWLCRKCHMNSDGRMKNLALISHMKRLKNIYCNICGKNFKPKRSTTRFCSKSCARTYHNLYVRQY